MKICKAFCKIVSREKNSFELNSIDYDSWCKIYSFAENNGLLSILFHSICSKKITVPFVIIEKLRQDYINEKKIQNELESQIDELAELLSNNGINHILLKGSHLIKSFYKHKSLRQMCDIDVLIQEEDFEKILPILYQKEYYIREKNYVYSEKVLDRHFPAVFSKIYQFPLEFHWALKKREPSCFIGRIFSRSLPLSPKNLNTRVMSAEDLVIFLCYHKIELDNFVFGLKTLYDIAEVFSMTNIDYLKLRENVISDWDCMKSLFLGLYFSEKLMNAPIDKNFITSIMPDSFEQPLEEAIEHILFSEIQYNKKISIFQALASRKFLSKIFNKIFLPKREIVLQYDIKPDKTTLKKTYIVRLFSLFFQYCLFFLIETLKNRIRKDIILSREIALLSKWVNIKKFSKGINYIK